MSAGLYGDFMALATTAKMEFKSEYGGGSETKKVDTTGGGFGLFFDATYVEIGLGFDFVNSKDPDNSDDKGTDINYFSISLLGKYPIALSPKATLFPIIGFDWNVFMSGKDKESGNDLPDPPDDYKDNYDAFIIDLGVGADFALSDKLYLRASAMYGIKCNSKMDQKQIDGDLGPKTKIFTGGVTIKAGVGYKF
jgi:opacity protein-like surface antigen